MAVWGGGNIQSISPIVSCSPSRVFQLQWPYELVPLLTDHILFLCPVFTPASFLLLALPQTVCEENVHWLVLLGALVQHWVALLAYSPSDNDCISQARKQKEGGRKGEREWRGGGRKKEPKKEKGWSSTVLSRTPSPPIT